MSSGLLGIRMTYQQVVISVSLSLIRPHKLVFVAKPLWSWDEKTHLHKGIMLIYGTRCL